MPIGTFLVDLDHFGATTEKQMDVIFRKTALDLLSSIIAGRPYGAGTPVAVVNGGRARGNWHVEVGALVDRFDENLKDKRGDQTIREGNAVIQNRVKIGDTIFIMNNVPYIIELEHGHSRLQAPAGMVRVALTAFPYIVERAARS